MPGYNHYPDCMCGWCYKTGSNWYSSPGHTSNFDQWSANRFLSKHGAKSSYTACFVNSNACCPICGAAVFYYQNSYGSRLFFDELGWPWPKHPCTDNSNNSTAGHNREPTPFTYRNRGIVTEIFDAAKIADFDINADFRRKYGDVPWGLLLIDEAKRVGFQNYLKSNSISRRIDEPIFLTFTSAKLSPSVGDFFSFNDGKISIPDPDLSEPKQFEADIISQECFEQVNSEGQA